MKKFIRGQRAKLADLTPSTAIEVAIKINFTTPKEFDCSCFGVADNNQLSDDRYFIFYNQKKSPDGSIVLLSQDVNDIERFRIDISNLPQSISKLVFTSTLNDESTMAEVKQGYLCLSSNDGEVAKFYFNGFDFSTEKAIILAELYLKEVWRFNAVGQGFSGGLRELLKHFGGEEESDSEPSQNPPATPLHSTENHQQNSTESNIKNLPSKNKNKRSCNRCGKKIGFFGKFSFNQKTGRCDKCDSDVQRCLQNFRQLFLEYCKNGMLTNSEWEELKGVIQRDCLDMESALAFVREDALNLLERTLSLAFADGMLTDQEESDFYQLQTKLSIPDKLAKSLLERLAYLKEITLIRQGHLPVMRASVILESEEICHMETSATYWKIGAKSVSHIAGRLIITNKQLHFVSQKGGWRLKIGSIMRIEEFPGKVNLELATKQGNGSYSVPDSLLVSAVIDSLVRTHKRQMLIPQTERTSRLVPHNVRLEVWHRDQGKCVQCGNKEYLEYDHIIPYSKGGASTTKNIQLLCRKCNLAKGGHI